MLSKDDAKLLGDFCDCIFFTIEYDSVFNELSKKAKELCDKNKHFFLKIDDRISKSVMNFATMQNIVNEKYDNYVTRMSQSEQSPFENFSKDVLDEFMKAFEKYYGEKIPNTFKVIKDMISSKFRESHVFFLYIQERFYNINKSLNSRLNATEKKYTENLETYVDNITKDTEKKCNSIKEKMKSKIQRETTKTSIEVLSVFAAVILTFSGMFTFSASVLQNMNIASIYRVVFTSLIVAFVCFNMLLCLLSYLNKLIKTEKKNHTMLIIGIITNVVILLAFGGIWCLWNGGFVEKRNQDLKQNTAVVEQDNTVVETDPITEREH